MKFTDWEKITSDKFEKFQHRSVWRFRRYKGFLQSNKEKNIIIQPIWRENYLQTLSLLGWIFTRKWHKKIILLRIFPLTGKTGYNNEKITLLSSQDFFVRSLLFYFRTISKGPFLLQLFLGYNNIYWILGFQSLSKILRLGKNT